MPALVIAGALVIMFVVDGGEHPYADYLQATTMPMAILLPVVGILAVTSEWSQRTALVTFTLEARRLRVVWAKVLATLLVGVAAVALSLALGTAAHAAAITFRGIEGDWTVSDLALAGLRLDLARARHDEVSKRVSAGLASPASLALAESELRGVEAHAMRAKLNVDEIKATSLQPRDDLNAPLVS